jgi:hypothetical protein
MNKLSNSTVLICVFLIISCASTNRFFDINNRDYYANLLGSLEEKYGVGKYYEFQAVNFSETHDRNSSLERLKKLIYMYKYMPSECRKYMKIIDESWKHFERGGESIYIRCSED